MVELRGIYCFLVGYQSLVDYSGVNQRLMGKSMGVSGALKHTLVRGMMCEADSPGAFTLNT